MYGEAIWKPCIYAMHWLHRITSEPITESPPAHQQQQQRAAAGSVAQQAAAGSAGRTRDARHT